MSAARDLQAIAEWCAFFYRPSLYLHPSRLKEIVGVELFQVLSKCSQAIVRTHSHFSSLILQKHHHLLPSFAKIDPEIWALLTVSIKKLHIIAFVLGALEIGPWLRSRVDAASVKSMTEVLGTQLLSFIRTRHAGFYSGSKQWMQHDITLGKKLHQLIEECGYALLARTVEAWPKHLRTVWMMRLPIKLNEGIAAHFMPIDALKLSMQIRNVLGSIFQKS